MEKRPPSENTAGAGRVKLSQGLTEQALPQRQEKRQSARFLEKRSRF